MITRSNYEVYFIDYFDGLLDKAATEQLFSFLEKNPDLKNEFDLFKNIDTEADLNIVFNEKDKLKKDTITNRNYKTWLVGDLEDDLSKDQKKELDLFLSKNPSLKTEKEILKNTISIPDHGIIFPAKKSIRKTGKVIIMTPAVKQFLSVAAVLLFFFITYFALQQLKNASDKSPSEIVKQEKVTPEFKGNDQNKSPLLNDTIQKDPLVKSAENKINLAETKIRVKEKSPGRIHNNINPKSPEKVITPINNIPETAEVKKDTVRIKSESVQNNNTAYSNPPETKITRMELSEIFDEQELKDLGLKAEKKNTITPTNAETLANLALNELKRLSKSADISVIKNNNPQATTYALIVGKNFSVSHTSVK